MTGLPRSIIKKYGVSKKAWAVFRAGKHTTHTIRHKTKARYTSMAKHKKRSFSRKSSKGGLMMALLGGAIYGGVRAKVSNAVKTLTDKIPLGIYADNVSMGLLSWAVATGKIPLINKMPMMRQIGKAGLIIEAALLGVDAVNNGFNLSTSGSSSNNGLFDGGNF